MSTTIARIKIPNANMVAMTPASQYYINSNGTLTLAGTSVTPPTVFDATDYRAIKVIIAVGSPGLTTAAGGQVTIQPSVLPEIASQPAAGMLTFVAADGVAIVTGLGAAAATLSGSRSLGVENSATPAPVLMSQFVLELVFSTSPTAGADLYLWCLGFGWKSYE